jgi:hypothetical protein
MVENNWQFLIMLMRERGIEFDNGLTDVEVKTVETRFGFQFPPDLREFLQLGLPRGMGFPDWRAGRKKTLQESLDMPLEGILFDVEYNEFWLEEWGARPQMVSEAKRIVGDLIADAPQLIPIYIHRMMPDEPHLPGNPVFSVHQADIILYGTDLENYLCAEFGLPANVSAQPDEIRPIRFWNIDRFQQARWAGNSCVTDPRTLTEGIGKAVIQNQANEKHRKWWHFWK